MNQAPLRPTVIVSLLTAICTLPLGVLTARGQQFGGVTPIANTVTTPVASATPATTSQTAPNAENPPPVDPNAPVETEILASNGATFVSQDRIAVFEGDVRVNDPRFQLACDKLTVFLAKGALAGGDKAAATTNGGAPAAPSGKPATKGANDGGTPGGGIERARAEGHVIIIQKRPPAKPGEEAKVSMGRAQQADFDNKTGDMVLHGMPSIEQNGNMHIALADSTVITLHKDNSMTTQGPSRTVIKQSKGSSLDLPGTVPAPSPGGNKKKKNNGGPQG